jgi:YVTN family beta-propeller protein
MKTRKKILVGATLLAVLLAFAVPARTQEKQSEPAPRQVFVVNTQDASVSVVDLTSMKEIRRFPVRLRPYGIAVSKDGKTVAVGVEDEKKIKFFDTTIFKLKDEIGIGKMFNDYIVLTTDGKYILVANFYSDDVLAIEVNTMKEAYRIKGISAPHVVKYGPLKKRAYVIRGSASFIS